MCFTAFLHSSSSSTGKMISTRLSRVSRHPVCTSHIQFFLAVVVGNRRSGCAPGNCPQWSAREMFSLMPGIPAFRQQMPRIISSIFTPAAGRFIQGSNDLLASHREFIFAIICAGFPSFALSFSRSISFKNLSRSQMGATT